MHNAGMNINIVFGTEGELVKLLIRVDHFENN